MRSHYASAEMPLGPLYEDRLLQAANGRFEAVISEPPGPVLAEAAKKRSNMSWFRPMSSMNRFMELALCHALLFFGCSFYEWQVRR
jgi:hypothetical protein